LAVRAFDLALDLALSGFGTTDGADVLDPDRWEHGHYPDLSAHRGQLERLLPVV